MQRLIRNYRAINQLNQHRPRSGASRHWPLPVAPVAEVDGERTNPPTG